MTRGRHSLVVLLCAISGGCADRRPDRTAGALEGRVVKELGALQAGGTPADWLRTHPADSFAIFAPARDRDNNRPWCARASARDTLPGGEPVVRRAYFYPPAPPSSLELPAESAGPDLVRRECLLAAIWIESPVSDTSAGRARAEAIRAAMGRLYGPVRPGPDAITPRPLPESLQKAVARFGGFESLRLGVSFFGSAGWRTLGRWEADSATIVSAFDAGLGPTAPRRVLGIAFFPRSGFVRPPEVVSDLDDDPAADTRFSAAARRAGLDARATAAMLALPSSHAPDSVHLAALRTWLAAARGLDSAHRAAALFVADGAAPPGFERKDSAALVPFQALGFEFVFSELDGGYNYTHNLLEHALRLDPDGPIGEMVRLYKVHRGFNLNGMCGGGGDAFRKVIAEGEALLAGAKDPGLQAELHFLIGDGYADIVALAAGEGDEYADTTAYAPEAAQARRNAIAQYRAGLGLDRRSAKARSSWLEAWRLMAGLPPTTTHFFCVYD
ncbi:MAG TPA: hypothetical protein VEU74_05510 [Gemmatimonadales bacterium]|nr:hypothetical protein [Gemmatimonadales bacterium]